MGMPMQGGMQGGYAQPMQQQPMQQQVCHPCLEPRTSRPQTALLLTRASLALDSCCTGVSLTLTLTLTLTLAQPSVRVT